MTNSTICSVTVDGRKFDVARVGDVLRATPVGADELAEGIATAIANRGG